MVHPIRPRWVFLAAILLAFVTIVLWPREDPYRFLRSLRPIETVRTIRAGTPFAYGERTFSFMQAPAQVEQVLLTHYFYGRRENFGLPQFLIGVQHADFQWTSDGSWPPRVQCRVVVDEARPWLDRQIDALRRLLHL